MNYLEKAKEIVDLVDGIGVGTDDLHLYKVNLVTAFSKALKEAQEIGLNNTPSEYVRGYEQGLKVGRAEMPKKIEEIVNYCAPHLDEMWAARIVSILIGCDFRDASGELAKRRKEGT